MKHVEKTVFIGKENPKAPKLPIIYSYFAVAKFYCRLVFEKFKFRMYHLPSREDRDGCLRNSISSSKLQILYSIFQVQKLPIAYSYFAAQIYIADWILKIKILVSTNENAVKYQIYIALATYLLLQLMVRTNAKKKHAFSNFVEKIRTMSHILSEHRL